MPRARRTARRITSPDSACDDDGADDQAEEDDERPARSSMRDRRETLQSRDGFNTVDGTVERRPARASETQSGDESSEEPDYSARGTVSSMTVP